MEVEHFDRTLIAFRDRVPFRPFTVSLINGDRFEVDHPRAFVVRFDYEGVNSFTGDLINQPS